MFLIPIEAVYVSQTTCFDKVNAVMSYESQIRKLLL